MQNNLVLIRGGGDLASGVALRLHRAGIKTLIAELAEPLAVRRTVCFSEAVYAGQIIIEGITGRFVQTDQIQSTIDRNEIPVLVDPGLSILKDLSLAICVLVDGRMLKGTPEPLPRPVPLHIGLGPGFHAGENCHAAIETRRSHTLGRVYWNGHTQPDSGQPEGDQRRVLRAPANGVIKNHFDIAAHVKQGELIAEVDHKPVVSPFDGVIRGLIHEGLMVSKGMKIGDVDPRNDPRACFLVSDKALAIGGGALEAILSKPEIREHLWD
jgi:xanthine dehydrogenase accessory factor